MGNSSQLSQTDLPRPSGGAAMPRVAWVTGGSGGIGRAVALSLAAGGFTVAVSGRREDQVEETVELVRAAGGQAAGFLLDVTSDESVAAVHGEVVAQLGAVELLVCGAGTNVRNRWWDDLDPAGFARVVDTNLNSVARCVSAVLPAMRDKGFGQIIVISSWAGWKFMSGAGAAYGASKTALAPLVESINDQEGRRGIRATHLCPGEVDTPILMTRPVPPGPEDLARMLQPENVGQVVAFIASLPPAVCVNELVLTPVWNRMLIDYSAYQG